LGVVQLKSTGLASWIALWETVGMPKDRKKTFSDRQSQASRAKKQPKKKATKREDFSQAAPRIVREATEDQ
jgi:hypothetical protein